MIIAEAIARPKYVFWEEKLPEVLARFGEPELGGQDFSDRQRASDWTKQFEARLQDNQNILASESARRDPSAFTCLQRNRTGVGGIYDLWRSLRSRLRGETFSPEHGTK